MPSDDALWREMVGEDVAEEMLSEANVLPDGLRRLCEQAGEDPAAAVRAIRRTYGKLPEAPAWRELVARGEDGLEVVRGLTGKAA